MFEKFHCGCKTIQHKPRGCNVQHGFRCLHPVRVVFAEAAVAAQPGEAALDDPCQPGDFERALPALHDLQLPAVFPHEFSGQLAALVTSIGDNRADSWKTERSSRPASEPPARRSDILAGSTRLATSRP